MNHKILEFVQKEKIDILVIGTHGRTGMEHAFLGSVAEKVIRRSPIPVFVIPCRVTIQSRVEGYVIFTGLDERFEIYGRP